MGAVVFGGIEILVVPIGGTSLAGAGGFAGRPDSQGVVRSYVAVGDGRDDVFNPSEILPSFDDLPCCRL
jgi:hypothetical protein